MNQMLNYILPVLLLIFVFVVSKLIKNSRGGKEFNYQTKGPLFSKAENVFFHYLLRITPQGFAVMGKVRVEDLIYAVRDKGYIVGRNKIRAKHVDFVMIKIDTGEIAGILELNDNSHLRLDRKDRDEFLDQAFSSCGIKILWVTVSNNYDANHEIEAYIREITRV